MTSEIRAVALDVDGTLAGADHRVSARSAATLAALQDRGVTPVIVTGRTETAAITISNASRLTAPVVSCNGAVVTDPRTGERLKASTLEAETVNRIVAFAAERGTECILWSATDMYAAKSTDATSLLEVINQQPVVIAPLDAVVRDDVVKVMLSGNRERLDEVQDQLATELPLLKRSMDLFYETSSPGSTKWEALRLVLNRLGIAPRDCMGIADGDTDVGWLSGVGLPVAVENARPSVREIASMHIGHHADDSVAQFLEAFFDLSRK